MKMSVTSLHTNLLQSILPSKEECQYTSCYCEENVWLLCDCIQNQASPCIENVAVLFISNPEKAIPIWEQKAAEQEGAPVIWDYHVIMLMLVSFCNTKRYYVYDLDTLLPFPIDLPTYVKKALRSDSNLKAKYYRYIKIIPAVHYLKNFASDRSHMKSKNGEWLATPPSYPCIQTKECSMNLDSYINMEANSSFETVYSLDNFVRKFCPEVMGLTSI